MLALAWHQSKGSLDPTVVAESVMMLLRLQLGRIGSCQVVPLFGHESSVLYGFSPSLIIKLACYSPNLSTTITQIDTLS